MSEGSKPDRVDRAGKRPCANCGHGKAAHTAPAGVVDDEGCRVFCAPEYPAAGYACGCPGYEERKR